MNLHGFSHCVKSLCYVTYLNVRNKSLDILRYRWQKKCTTYGLFTLHGNGDRDRNMELDKHKKKRWILVPFPVLGPVWTFLYNILVPIALSLHSVNLSRSHSCAVWISHKSVFLVYRSIMPKPTATPVNTPHLNMAKHSILKGKRPVMPATCVTPEKLITWTKNVPLISMTVVLSSVRVNPQWYIRHFRITIHFQFEYIRTLNFWRYENQEISTWPYCLITVHPHGLVLFSTAKNIDDFN